MKDASEHAHQATLIAWFDKEYPEIGKRLLAIPNGGLRNKTVAMKLKLEGVRPGVPDIFLPVPNWGFCGLFIEMKRLKGNPSPEQKDWIEFLNSQGYHAEVANGCEKAKAIIKDYLTGYLK